jgi:hypothetical protein
VLLLVLLVMSEKRPTLLDNLRAWIVPLVSSVPSSASLLVRLAPLASTSPAMLLPHVCSANQALSRIPRAPSIALIVSLAITNPYLWRLPVLNALVVISPFLQVKNSAMIALLARTTIRPDRPHVFCVQLVLTISCYRKQNVPHATSASIQSRLGKPVALLVLLVLSLTRLQPSIVLLALPALSPLLRASRVVPLAPLVSTSEVALNRNVLDVPKVSIPR